jgi:hypothetical protein
MRLRAPTPTIVGGDFLRIRGVKLYGLILFPELRQVDPDADGQALLADLVAAWVASARTWTDIGTVARQLFPFAGEAVLCQS